MIIIMSSEQAESAKAIANDYPDEPVALFSDELSTCLHTTPPTTLSFYGHGAADKDGKVIFFGCQSPTLEKTTGFQGYTPEEFVTKLLELGLSKQTQILELWGCGIGDKVDGYSYAGQVAILLAEKNLYPQVRSVSSENKSAAIGGQTVLTHDFDYQSYETKNWKVRGIGETTLVDPEFIRIKKDIAHYSEMMAETGAELMSLRAQEALTIHQADASPIDERTTEDIDEAIERLESRLDNNYSDIAIDKIFSLLGDEQEDDLTELLVDEIPNYYLIILSELKKDEPNKEKIAKHYTIIENLEGKALKLASSGSDSTIEAYKIYQQRSALYREQIDLVKQLKMLQTTPQTESLAKQIARLNDAFLTAETKLNKYVHAYNKYYTVINEFRDIRAHMRHPDCNFSVAHRDTSVYGSGSPTLLHQPQSNTHEKDNQRDSRQIFTPRR